MDLDGHKITNNKEAKAAGYNNYKDYLDAQKYYNKQSNGGKKTSNNVTPSGSNIVITYEDSGGHEQVYIPDPRQYYIIQYYLKKEASIDSAIDRISKELFNNSKLTIKQILTFKPDDNGETSNISVLGSVTSQDVSKSTQEYIKDNLADIVFRNNLGEIYCNKVDTVYNGYNFNNKEEMIEKWWAEDYDEASKLAKKKAQKTMDFYHHNKINEVFEGFKPNTEYVKGTEINNNILDLFPNVKNLQCGVYIYQMLYFLTGDEAKGADAKDKAYNLSKLTDENGEPKYDYYSSALGNLDQAPTDIEGTVTSVRYKGNDGPGHAFINVRIESNNIDTDNPVYFTDANVNYPESIRVQRTNILSNYIDTFLNNNTKSGYSQIDIAVPRR